MMFSKEDKEAAKLGLSVFTSAIHPPPKEMEPTSMVDTHHLLEKIRKGAVGGTTTQLLLAAWRKRPPTMAIVQQGHVLLNLEGGKVGVAAPDGPHLPEAKKVGNGGGAHHPEPREDTTQIRMTESLFETEDAAVIFCPKGTQCQVLYWVLQRFAAPFQVELFKSTFH
ncbi:hypothetical protein JD844_003708 [Phrynosoma platyrhinos]|uniref:Uncharacterized protein n=1 Tax=Phrynosoma platyrhinos TaxID=52577 RepID=A0ABQ7TD23_PHRPL|nr:hypothetical protein JD844_003708 [Phrynosoma platyrhinos]